MARLPSLLNSSVMYDRWRTDGSDIVLISLQREPNKPLIYLCHLGIIQDLKNEQINSFKKKHPSFSSRWITKVHPLIPHLGCIIWFFFLLFLFHHCQRFIAEWGGGGGQDFAKEIDWFKLMRSSLNAYMGFGFTAWFLTRVRLQLCAALITQTQ